MSKEVTTTPRDAVAPRRMTPRGLQVETLDEMTAWAKQVIDSGMAPSGFTKPAQVVLASQYGMELGFSLARSLSCITVVNGRAGIMGDAAKALIRNAGVLAPGTDFEEFFDGDGGDRKAVCRTHRDGVAKAFETEFSVKDAKRAGLWERKGPWTQYPGRMMAYRALGFHVRDFYSDVTLGLYTSEELHDFPVKVHDVTPGFESIVPEEQVPDPLMDQFKAELEKMNEADDADFSEPQANAATEGGEDPELF